VAPARFAEPLSPTYTPGALSQEGKRFHEKAGRRQVLFLGPGSPMRPTTDQREARYTFKLITSWKCVWPFLTSPTADSPCFHSHS